MKFQIERIALFSDAVFAIAITLMIIEVKAPELEHEISFSESLVTIGRLIPSFVGVALSFFFIGIFWIRHHHLLKYLTGYTNKLLLRNLTFLLTIVFIPFSTAFVFENIHSLSPLPLIFYNLNYIVASLFNYRLFSYVLNPANQIRTEIVDEDVAVIKKEILFPIAVYVFIIILSCISIQFAPMGYAAFALERFFIPKKKDSGNVPQTN